MVFRRIFARIRLSPAGRRALLVSLVLGLTSWVLFQYSRGAPRRNYLVRNQELPSLHSQRNGAELKSKGTAAPQSRAHSQHWQAPPAVFFGAGRQVSPYTLEEDRAMFVPRSPLQEPIFPASRDTGFTFIANPIAIPAQSSDLLYGVSVSGPILRGGAVARDSRGIPVATTQQPNLLTAGRGFIPSKDTSPVAAKAARANTTAANAAQEATSPTEDESATKSRSFNRGFFRFEVDESGATSVFNTQGPESAPIARIAKSTGVVEQVSFIGSDAAQNWNKFVGELFLIAVAPELVGQLQGSSFQVQSVEPDNFFNVVGLESGDLLVSADGVEMSAFDLEILPDLLLAGSTNLVVKAQEQVRVISLSFELDTRSF
jgi:hypothetical protein